MLQLAAHSTRLLAWLVAMVACAAHAEEAKESTAAPADQSKVTVGAMLMTDYIYRGNMSRRASLAVGKRHDACFARNHRHFHLTVVPMKCQNESAWRFPYASRGCSMKLDAKPVAALKLDGKTDSIFFDDAMPGFGYRLRASGSEVRKSWVVQYRRAGATRRMLLGSAEVLSAEQARSAAKKALGAVALGQDPQKEKTTRRSADKFTLAAMVEEFLLAKEGTVRPRTFTEARRYLQGVYFKTLHSMPVDQITRRDVAARVLVITRESGARTAVAARGALSELFAWGMGQGLVEHNPVIGTNRPKTSRPRDRVLSDQELAAVWNAAGDDDFGRILR